MKLSDYVDVCHTFNLRLSLRMFFRFEKLPVKLTIVFLGFGSPASTSPARTTLLLPFGRGLINGDRRKSAVEYALGRESRWGNTLSSHGDEIGDSQPSSHPISGVRDRRARIRDARVLWSNRRSLIRFASCNRAANLRPLFVCNTISRLVVFLGMCICVIMDRRTCDFYSF